MHKREHVRTSIITVDGPSGAGKGTLCRALAAKLHWHLLDSGALYRVLALAIHRLHIHPTIEAQVAAVALKLDTQFISRGQIRGVFLFGEEVSSQIGTEQVGSLASQIALFPQVREVLLEKQRAFYRPPGLVADGRDMGSVVFPDAAVKIFLSASLEERARRRLTQLQRHGFNVKFKQLLGEMEKRDQRDMQRGISALAAAEGAFILDSTTLASKSVFKRALSYVQQRMELPLDYK